MGSSTKGARPADGCLHYPEQAAIKTSLEIVRCPFWTAMHSAQKTPPVGHQPVIIHACIMVITTRPPCLCYQPTTPTWSFSRSPVFAMNSVDRLLTCGKLHRACCRWGCGWPEEGGSGPTCNFRRVRLRIWMGKQGCVLQATAGLHSVCAPPAVGAAVPVLDGCAHPS
jgi:hypothetical protein